MDEWHSMDYLYKKYADEAYSMRPPLSVLIDHIDHIAKLVGADYVGIGSDFDGIILTPKELDDVTTYPIITKALVEKGYREKDILKRVFKRFGSKLESKQAQQTDGPAKALHIKGTNTSVATISAVSNNFCSSCNRVRLTAKGELILCLGQKDSVSLRDALRSGMTDTEIKQLIVDAITKKPEKHFFDSVIDNISSSQMVEIGG